jgi:diadenosine tetraphosphate (Ap4A) HIT family hydrolase
MTLYYFGNFRVPEQLAEMRRLEREGVCLFCPEHLSASSQVLHRTALWTVVPNRYPYRETRLHLLLVPDEHVTDMADLSEDAQRDFWATLRWVKIHYGLAHYGLAARNGDSEFTGGTIRHLHVHLLQGDVDDPEHQGVRVRLSSRPA